MTAAARLSSLLAACLLFASPLLVHGDKCTTGFSVVAPEAAVPGRTTAVLVTLHQALPRRPVNVTLRLETQAEGRDNDSTIVAVTSKIIYGHGIIPLRVPLVPGGPHTLHARLACPAAPAACALAPATGPACPGDECQVLRSHSLLRVAGPVRDVLVRTDRKIYNQGDTVTIWVMALDYDLHLPKNILGTVFLKDPAGTKVAIWDQVSMDEGVKKFSIGLSPRALTGTWSLHVSCGGGVWSSALNVSGQGAGNWAASRAGGGLSAMASSSSSGGARQPAAEEHYVELRFSPETRRRYKPGLPYSGKVEAVSTEKYIRVRVKVFDNTTSIYSQDIEITQREGIFSVPAVLADSDVVVIQAELVAVEGKEIESHYILAREPLVKWNSTSDCYILIEGMEKPFQVGSHAVATVVSTCPCDQDAHMAVVTGGRATHWAERRAPASVGGTTVLKWSGPSHPGFTFEGSAVCRFNYSFPVKSDMAPSSQLLVYYVTAEGEPVSDVVEFQVLLVHKQISVVVELHPAPLTVRPTHPAPGPATDAGEGEDIQVHVTAEPGSLVCLIGGTEEPEMFDPWIRIHHRQDPSGQPSEDFLQAGLSLFQRRCGGPGPEGGAAWSATSGTSSVTYRRPDGERRGKPLLPQHADNIWMWDCFNYTLGNAHRRVHLPGAPALVWAASLGAEGLRAGVPLLLPGPRVQTLVGPLAEPPPLTSGEQLELDISISNPIMACVDVIALLSLNGGGQFVSNGMMYVTERLRLGPKGATALVVRILVTKPGVHNLTADISGYLVKYCGSPGMEQRAVDNGTPFLRALREARVTVRPEGRGKTDTESAYFCANEHTLISTKDRYAYEWISAPRNRAGLVFEVRARKAVRVALSDQRKTTDSMYHVTIGDGDNSLTWIGRGQHGYSVHLASAETPDALSGGEFRTYWLSWERGALALGRGASPGEGAAVATWALDASHKVRHVGFSAPWGEEAEFRVWNFNDEAGFSQVVQLSLPRWAVPGSASGELLVAGGLALPSASRVGLRAGSAEGPGADATVNLPTSLASAAAALAPLLILEQANETEHEEMMKQLPGLIQTLLSFRRNDNSFSDHPSMGSHLSSVHILEVLTKAQSFFGVDPELLESVKRWVQLRQEDDGSFTPLPADIKISLLTTDADIESVANRKSSGNNYEELDYGIVEKWKNLSKDVLDLERNVEVTADTLATLLEIGIENSLDADTVLKAKQFLEKNLFNVSSSYPLASMVYALVLCQSALVPEAMERLRNASTTEEGDFGWPHPLPRREADWLYEEDSTRRVNPPLLTSLEDFKASLSTLLVHTALGDLRSAEPVARYLFYRSHLLDSHTELLYHAVKAFTAFSALAYDRHRSLTVSLATAGMELTDTVELRAHHPARHLHLPSLPTKVFVYATGAGCATVQGRITYSTYTPSSDNALLTLWSAVIEEIRPDRSSLEELQGKLPTLNIKTCFRWKSKERSGVLRLEVSLFSGYELISVNPVVVDGGNFADLQHGSKENFVWFAFANISSTCPVCINYQIRSTFVFSSLRPAFATIYPATRPDLAAEIFFHTKPGSSLLKGITEDDLITWFGKTDTGVPNVGQDIPNICECGKVCRNTVHQITTTDLPIITTTQIEATLKEDSSMLIKINGNISSNIQINSELSITNITKDSPIIIPSVLISKDVNFTVSIINNDTNDTKNSPVGDEIVIQQKSAIGRKLNPAKMLFDVAKKQPYQKKQPMPRKKGTLKHTYGENHEMLKKNVKVLYNTNNISTTTLKSILNSATTNLLSEIITENIVTSSYANIKTSNESEFLKPTTDKKSFIEAYTTTDSPSRIIEVEKSTTLVNNMLNFDTTVAPQTRVSSIVSAVRNSYMNKKESLKKIEAEVNYHSSNAVNDLDQNLPVPTKVAAFQIPKSINREKQHPPSIPISETTLGLISEVPPVNFLPNKNDQLFVIDKNALWGLLKEVVRIEMDKNQEKIEAESNAVDSKKKTGIKEGIH